MRPLALVALALLLLTPDVQAGDRCPSKIVVYGAMTQSPRSEAPLEGASAGACVRATDLPDVEHGLLLPNATHVRGEWRADLGASVSSLTIAFEGLGFTGEAFPMPRVPGSFALPAKYAMPSYVDLPDPTAKGLLVARVQLPDGSWDNRTYEKVA